jgi:hypothetical protein
LAIVNRLVVARVVESSPLCSVGVLLGLLELWSLSEVLVGLFFDGGMVCGVWAVGIGLAW